MKVFNLRCSNGHGFEGWFASDDAYQDQNGRGLIECPSCADRAVSRLPSAPRLNLSGAREPATEAVVAPGPDLHELWLHTVRQVVKNTVDVGPRFAEEARRIHYGEAPSRGIRGQATAQERSELVEEGIEVMQLPIPKGLDGPAH